MQPLPQGRTSGEVVLALHVGEMTWQLRQQLLLRLLLAHHGRHLLPQVPNDEAVDLARPHPFHKLVHLRSPKSTCQDWVP